MATTALREEAIELLRGLTGGFLFAMPVLFTMEMWQLGYTLPTAHIMLLLAAAYLMDVGLNYASGFRQDVRRAPSFQDGVISLAIGIVVAAVMLYVTGVAHADAPPVVMLKQVLILAVPVSIGASLARTMMGDEAEHQREPRPSGGPLRTQLREAGTVAGGAVFLAFSAAPTEEILLIAIQGDWLRWLCIVALSLALSNAMVFHAHFAGQAHRLASTELAPSPWRDTVVAYAISLAVAALLVWFLGYAAGRSSWGEALTMTVVLGLPAALGGAAGKLIL